MHRAANQLYGRSHACPGSPSVPKYHLVTPRNTRTGGVLERMVRPALDRGGYVYRVQVNIGQRFGCGTQNGNVVAFVEHGSSSYGQETSGKHFRTAPAPTEWANTRYWREANRMRPATIAGLIRSFRARWTAASAERRRLAGLVRHAASGINASPASASASCSRTSDG